MEKLETAVNNIANHFNVADAKHVFYVKCKQQHRDLYWKKGAMFRNMILHIIPKKMAAQLLLQQVRDVYAHPIHQDYKIDVIYRGRIVRGQEVPDYRIRLKPELKVEFNIEGTYP